MSTNIMQNLVYPVWNYIKSFNVFGLSDDNSIITSDIIQYALTNGHLEFVKYLIESGANIRVNNYSLIENSDINTIQDYIQSLNEYIAEANQPFVPRLYPVDITESETCPICYENYENPCKTICNHVYCRDCIQTWAQQHQHCPLCREQM